MYFNEYNVSKTYIKFNIKCKQRKKTEKWADLLNLHNHDVTLSGNTITILRKQFFLLFQ